MDEHAGAGMQLQGLDQLLATKLHIPASSQSLVPRPRLLESRNEGMERKRILLSAPAGFGKTTLLCEWMRSPAGKGRSHKPMAQLDWLKARTSRTNILHMLVGNFDVYDFCHLNAQAARRMRDLPFARYHLDNQTECEEFVGALRALMERVQLSVAVSGLLSHWRWFGEWSLVCIGVLSDWLVETVDTLCKEGATTLTIEALTKHALQPDQRLRIEMEARTGEYKVERAKAQSEQRWARENTIWGVIGGERT